MVNYFFSGKIAAKMFFHNQSVLPNISKSISVRVLRAETKSIPITDSYPPFPSAMFFSAGPSVCRPLAISKFIGVAFYRAVFSIPAGHICEFFATGKAGIGFSSVSLTVALSSTKFLDSIFFKLSPTGLANVFHFVLQIKKAAFSGLKKTVRFSHLLTAQIIFRTKNPFSLSNTIIPSYYVFVNPEGGAVCLT
jgi:hypothetical protein